MTIPVWRKGLLTCAICILCIAPQVYGKLIDRVAAFVDDHAITLSELNEMYGRTRKVSPDITRKEVLDTMINRVLILREAKRLKLEAANDDELFNEYVELKVRSYVRITDEQVNEYYRENIARFQGVPFESVREKIEEYLTEREVNRTLKRQIDELKKKVYIKINVEER
jgi:parvulin-like peptidyl-prolyl isomerase